MKEAKHAVPETTPSSPSSSTVSSATVPEEFGANEWLVEEMHERFQADPSSVDQTWVDYFKAHGSGSTNGAPAASKGGASNANGAHTATTSTTTTERKPEPKHAQRASTAPAPHVDPTPTPAPVAKPRPESKAAEPAKGTTNPVPKEQPPAAQADARDEPTYTVLRGAPARTAANMDVSLTVPTATSVRSVPVKLLWDNRTVINNHLARARGGKVSFTHLIGYALVKALRADARR